MEIKTKKYNFSVLIYNIQSNQDRVKILGNQFVRNNNNICKIVYENNEYNLTEYFDCKNISDNLLKLKLKGINNVIDLSSMFEECSQLSEFSDFSNLDTTYAVDMRYLFFGCEFENLTDIYKLNTRNVINMEEIFASCILLKSLPDISSRNTSNVGKLGGMFNDCISLEFLPDLSKWDISLVLKINKTSDMFVICSESLIIPEQFKNFKNKNIIKINYL